MIKEKVKAFVPRSVWERKASGILAMGFVLAVLLTLALVSPTEETIGCVFKGTCIAFRTPVILFCYLSLAVLIFLCCSRFGNIRLGGEKAKPEYSIFSWLSCLFMAGCGIGIVYYSQEPVMLLHANPYEGQVWGDATGVAYSLSLYNWTINNWCQFALLGVVMAYFHYNCGKDLRLSSVLPGNTPLWVRRGIDMVLAIGVMTGLSTSLGYGSVQLSKGFEHVFESEISIYVLMFFMAVIALGYVIAGLQKGMKWLSQITTVLVAIMLLSVVCIGVFRHQIYGFLSYIGKGAGLLLTNYTQYNDFYNATSSEWAADKFVFNNLWFSAWAVFVAVFMAKISKGRTIRQFILGAVGFPILFTIIWFGIFGCVGSEMGDVLRQSMSGDLPMVLFQFFEIISQNGYYVLLSALVMLIIILFFITSSDTGAYVMANLLSCERYVDNKDKIFWATIQCLVTMALFALGGLALIQSVVVIMGMVAMAMMCVGTYCFVKKLIKKEKK